MADRVLSGSRLVEILQGDTLQEIAARELGDASKWTDIANINGLVSPYLTGNPASANARVRLYGDTIIVPSATTQISAVNEPDRVFGVDVELADGSLRAKNGDISLVAGRVNLRQAISNRIDTGLKDLLFHLPYGCEVRRVMGTANGPTAGLLGAQYVRSALLLDPRVESVISVEAEIVGDKIAITGRVQPITGTTIDFSTTV